MDLEEGSSKEIKLKPMKCELNVLTKSDGSAIFSQGETVSLVSVNGPLDIKMQSQSVEKATLELTFASKGGKPCIEDRYSENVMRQACEASILSSLYPRTGITISVLELENYGGLLSCCLNCICLALINSGLSMRHAFAAVSCSVDELGNVVLEPKLDNARATMTFVFDSRDKSLVTASVEGEFTENAYKEAMQRSRVASDEVFEFYRSIVKKYSRIIG